jgi:hypothetical protein
LLVVGEQPDQVVVVPFWGVPLLAAHHVVVTVMFVEWIPA